MNIMQDREQVCTHVTHLFPGTRRGEGAGETFLYEIVCFRGIPDQDIRIAPQASDMRRQFLLDLFPFAGRSHATELPRTPIADPLFTITLSPNWSSSASETIVASSAHRRPIWKGIGATHAKDSGHPKLIPKNLRDRLRIGSVSRR